MAKVQPQLLKRLYIYTNAVSGDQGPIFAKFTPYRRLQSTNIISHDSTEYLLRFIHNYRWG